MTFRYLKNTSILKTFRYKAEKKECNQYLYTHHLYLRTVYLAAYTSCRYLSTKPFKFVDYMKFHTKMLHHIILHNIVANSLLVNEILFPNIQPMGFFCVFFLPQLTLKGFLYCFFSQSGSYQRPHTMSVTSQGSCKLGHWSVHPFYFCPLVEPPDHLS